MLVGGSAVLIGVCALGVSLYEASLMREEQRAAVIPLVEEYVANARQREAEILGGQFLERREALPFGELQADDRSFGTAAELGVPPAIRSWLDAHPGGFRYDFAAGVVYRQDPASDEYGALKLPHDLSETIVTRA